MDVKQAVAKAKQYVLELYQEEGISNLGLEEVEFDDALDQWAVTLGFSRPWDSPNNPLAALAKSAVRSYKVVHLDSATGEVLSLKNREFAA